MHFPSGSKPMVNPLWWKWPQRWTWPLSFCLVTPDRQDSLLYVCAGVLVAHHLWLRFSIQQVWGSSVLTGSLILISSFSGWFWDCSPWWESGGINPSDRIPSSLQYNLMVAGVWYRSTPHHCTVRSAFYISFLAWDGRLTWRAQKWKFY